MIHAKRKRRLQMAAHVRDFYSDVDQHLATAPGREQVQCRKGCSACCSMMIVITLPEAYALVTRYPRVVERAVPALEADLAEVMRIAEELKLPGKGQAFMLEEDARGELCSRWWQLQRPCPFLAPDSTCSVYEARPLPCRTYHVRTDPSLCAQVPAARVEIMTLHRNDEEQLMRAFRGLQMAAGIPNPFTCSALSEMVLHARKQLRQLRE